MEAPFLFLSMTDVDSAAKREFSAWCEKEYLPGLARNVAVADVRHYRAIEGGPSYLLACDLRAVGDLEQSDSLPQHPWPLDSAPCSRQIHPPLGPTTSGVYRHLLTRPGPGLADLSGARVLLFVGLEVDPAHDEEFQDWYNTEHIPSLCEVPGLIRARRYKLDPQAVEPVGDPVSYVALFDVEGLHVLTGDAWERRRTTPWTARMRRFRSRWLRTIYERTWPA